MGGGTQDLGIQNFGAQNKPESQKLFKGILSGLTQFLATDPFKNGERCFLCHLKSAFHSHNVYYFLTF